MQHCSNHIQHFLPFHNSDNMAAQSAPGIVRAPITYSSSCHSATVTTGDCNLCLAWTMLLSYILLCSSCNRAQQPVPSTEHSPADSTCEARGNHSWSKQQQSETGFESHLRPPRPASWQLHRDLYLALARTCTVTEQELERLAQSAALAVSKTGRCLT